MDMTRHEKSCGGYARTGVGRHQRHRGLSIEILGKQGKLIFVA